MAKKETLPVTVDLNDMEPGSNITYASDVVAIIAGIAAAVIGIIVILCCDGLAFAQSEEICAEYIMLEGIGFIIIDELPLFKAHF